MFVCGKRGERRVLRRGLVRERRGLGTVGLARPCRKRAGTVGLAFAAASGDHGDERREGDQTDKPLTWSHERGIGNDGLRIDREKHTIASGGVMTRTRATTPDAMRRILTPDRRLRVFVSSTLEELAEEREAVRMAIESLRLVPVMFEMGARPHAPRNLYRAYLAQSDVFLAVYWQRYGWVAPGEEGSGLAAELLLSPGKPRLVYVKHPAEAREPRMTSLLDGLDARGESSYKRFGSAEE